MNFSYVFVLLFDLAQMTLRLHKGGLKILDNFELYFKTADVFENS